MKKLFCTTLFIFPIVLMAQVHIELGVGANVKTKNPICKIAFGMEVNKVVLEVVEQPTITRKINSPNYFGGRAGYNINGFVPSVGYFYSHASSDDKGCNEWFVGYALKYQYVLTENGGLYAEAMYINNQPEITVGFHVIIN